MNIELIESILKNPLLHHALLITGLYCLAWVPALRQGFVSDDIEGLLKFSDRLHPQTKEFRDWYEHEVDGKKIKFRNLEFNKHITFPGSVIRFLRLNLGKKWKCLGKDKKEHEVFGYVQDPFRHHLINFIIHYVNVVLMYLLVRQLFGPTVALYSTLLFVVHPASCQSVVWCSGIGYLLCLLGALASYNIYLYVGILWVKLPMIVAFTFLSAYGLFSGALNWMIFLYLQAWIPALLCFGVFLLNYLKQGRQIVGHRTGEFKKQNMHKPTLFHWRKPIVMIKTFWYYLCMTIVPRRLGLFHEWGYHYGPDIEKMNGMFWKGFFSLVAYGALFYWGSPSVRFGLVWWMVYLLVFSNFITAMQFVADRYLFISTLGSSLVLSSFLQGYPAIIAFLIGCYLVRTWVHIPTYKDDIQFYLSNIWNFPNSEVARGNLGVSYMHTGRPGAAVDTWFDAIKVNKFYDVPHYNLYSMFKQNRQFQQAMEHLQACLNAKVVHFKDQWEKEMDQMKMRVKYDRPLNEMVKEMNKELQ